MAQSNDHHSAQLGCPVPVFTPHAVSVSLPLWQDNIDYELGLDRVKLALTNGYPRFFIHQDIQKLAGICRAAHALSPTERCMLFPSERAASLCRKFIADQARKQFPPEHTLEKRCRMVRFEASSNKPTSPTALGPESRLRVYVLFVPSDKVFEIARTFWQHTGLGISSRFAERCLRLMGSCPTREASSPTNPVTRSLPTPPISPRAAPRRYKKHSAIPVPPILHDSGTDEATSTYVEERYGRNLPIEHVHGAKLALRRRIADILQDDPNSGSASPLVSNFKRSERGAGQLTERDVYLYPNGMSSIFFAHQLAMALQTRLRSGQPVGKSICFGFPYTDTLKIVQKWGPGAHFFGHGETADLEALEDLLDKNAAKGDPPVAALFCEFPSNPLLKSPDLIRLRSLADRYGFLVVVDETIGNFVNVEVLPFADMLVSSLTKVFSGDSNVMGGSLILNPCLPHYQVLKELLDGSKPDEAGMYEDIYFGEDAIYMERNSRDFRTRVHKINQNASALCEFLEQLRASDVHNVLRTVHYPRYITPDTYEACRRKPDGAYGGLFSIIFGSPLAAQSFYDALATYKGPSLGTNFTLASPYAILAHFSELEWAAQFGVDPDLVRVSVGLEDLDVLLKWFKDAFEHACAVVSSPAATSSDQKPE